MTPKYQILLPGMCNVTLYDNDFAIVINLRVCTWRLSWINQWTLNTTTSVLTREKQEKDQKTPQKPKKPKKPKKGKHHQNKPFLRIILDHIQNLKPSKC